MRAWQSQITRLLRVRLAMTYSVSFGDWVLNIGICLVIVSCILVIDFYRLLTKRK